MNGAGLPRTTLHAVHASHAEPSPWIERWSYLVEPGARVLDVACGSGRHVRWFVSRLADVTGVDRDDAAVEPLRSVARIVVADIENEPWPFQGETFDAVVITNYLWRPLLPTIIASVAPKGLLLYETFGHQQPEFGHPKRPDFLLRPQELLRIAAGLHVLAYEDLIVDEPMRHVQRIAALRGQR
jgi:SAM-dependent methyltransferase